MGKEQNELILTFEMVKKLNSGNDGMSLSDIAAIFKVERAYVSLMCTQNGYKPIDHPRIITNEDVSQKVAELNRKGYTKSQICGDIGVSTQTLTNIIEYHKIKMIDKRRRGTGYVFDVIKARRLRTEGKSLEDISQEVGAPLDVLAKVLSKSPKYSVISDERLFILAKEYTVDEIIAMVEAESGVTLASTSLRRRINNLQLLPLSPNDKFKKEHKTDVRKFFDGLSGSRDFKLRKTASEFGVGINLIQNIVTRTHYANLFFDEMIKRLDAGEDPDKVFGNNDRLRKRVEKYKKKSPID